MSATLYRTLLSGSQYNALFPLPDGKKVNLGAGDTNTSIELIIQWALKHHTEVEKVAPLFLENNLEKTCFNIHHFLYNHFQYKADEAAQLLRSPAYAWKERASGIDCKSYSIIASCILLQLGVKHYIRKIKQPSFNPDAYTHVYVIVPANQNTGSLKNGYYTIDGTLPTTLEPSYIATKDFFMDKLKHYGLNGVHSYNPKRLHAGFEDLGMNGVHSYNPKKIHAGFEDLGLNGLGSTPDSADNPFNSDGGANGGDDSETIAAILKSLFNGLSSEKVKTWFKGPISCWGGSGFPGDKADQVQNHLINYYRDLFIEINVAVAKLDLEFVSELVAELKAMTKAGLCGYNQKQAEKKWNDCTRDSITKMVKLLNHYDLHIIPSFDKWLNFYFNSSKIGTKQFSSHETEPPPAGMFYSYTGNPCFGKADVMKYTLINPNSEIKAFEFTDYVIQSAANNQPIDIQKYFETAQTILRKSKVVNEIDDNGNVIYDEQNPKPDKKTSKAGSYLLGGVAITMLLSYAFNKSKDVKQIKN